MPQTEPPVINCLVRLIRRGKARRTSWLCVLWHKDRAVYRLVPHERNGEPPDANSLCQHFHEKEHMWTPWPYVEEEAA